MKHYTEDQIADYLNKYVVPQDLKITRMVLTNQTDKNGEAMISLRLRRYDPLTRKDVKEKRLATGIRVIPKNWSTKKGEVLKGDFNYQQKNRFVKDKESRVSNYINNPALDYIMAQLSREEFLIIEEVFPSPKILKYKKSLVNYIDDYHQWRKKKGDKHGTVKEFKSVMNRVKKFDDSRDQKTFLKEINISWSDDFEMWMIEEEYSKGTIQKTYTILKTVLNHYWARRNAQNIEMTDEYKSEQFKRGKRSKNKANPLTEEQLYALYNHHFDSERLNNVKKMICIQSFTGMRYADIKRIRPENFIEGYLYYRPEKTEHHEIDVEQPLNPQSKALFEEVDNDTSRYKISNQKYNEYIVDVLKVLQKEYPKLKYKLDFTSHNFRDTFISLAVQRGVNWKSIIDWVGHTSYDMMDRYVALTKPFEKSEMKKLFG